MGEILRFVEIGSDFKFADLGADIPIGVVVAGIGAGVDLGVGGFGEWVVGEPQLDLDGGECTFSNFCSWVYSFSMFLGTETLAFQGFWRSPR